jgi:phosphomannomutase/phosphoglucomutase
MSIYKACDIRGHYGSELINEHASRLGLALAQYCSDKEFIVGGDGRLSTPDLKQHLIAALSYAGCSVVDIGIVSTPALYFARQHLGVFPAVMVTASHNPPEDNGFKVSLARLPVSPDDITALAQIMDGITAEQLAAVVKHMASVALPRVRHIDIKPDYVAFALTQTKRLDGMHIVVDCANGAAALVARDVWGATGADVTYLYDTVDGHFPNHAPDPSHAENLQMLRQRVVDERADLGVAYDGDGDRVMFVDALGRPLSGDRSIVLFARRALAAGPAPIVYDQKCSLIVADAIRALNGEPVIERSGHTFIKNTFLRRDAPYAGEISGHHFFKLMQGDDGLVASLYMANLLKESGTSLAQLSDDIKSYPITPDIRVRMENASARRILDDLRKGLDGEARLVTLDGLRAEFADGWGIARLSVTEPAMTLRFEGKDDSSLQRIMRRFEQAAPALSSLLPIAQD